MFLPDGYGTVFPYIFAHDAPGYIAFLSTVFGAEEIDRTVAPDGRVVNSQLRIGTTQFMVSEASTKYPPMPASYYVFVADADAVLAMALQHGATLEMPVEDRPYQDRQGGVRDPQGNIWWISQRLVPGPYATHTV
jgi:PhnB protein